VDALSIFFHLPLRLKEWLVSSIRLSQVPLQIYSFILELLREVQFSRMRFREVVETDRKQVGSSRQK
jgi:hypothetical protein